VILRIQATPAVSNPPPDVTLKTPLRGSLSTHLQEDLAQRFGNGVRIAPITSPGALSGFVLTETCHVAMPRGICYNSYMGTHIKNILIGIRQVLVVWPGDDYVRPAKGGFLRDAKALREDARRITRGLRATTLRHEQQVHHS